MTRPSSLKTQRTLNGQWLVMTIHKVPAAVLYQIEQELDKGEKDTMLFLCQDLVPDSPALDVRALLMALNERELLTPGILAELLYRMKRFDLLKKVLGTSRAAVEASLVKNPRILSPYRVLMAEINEDLDKEDLESFVFLLLDNSGTSYMKKAKEKSFLGVINDLEKLDLVSPNQLDFLERCLLNIHRKDLVRKIQKLRLEAPVHTIGSAPVYINAAQVSFPKLSLADPAGVVNKGKLLNGSGAIQKELVPVPVPVPETGTAVSQGSDRYRMQSRPLGICLIIDCIGNDTGVLVEAFTALRFDVHCYPFLNVNSLPQKLYEVARLKQHKDYDCFVCVLVSRGNHQDVFCTDRIMPGFALEKVKKFFTGDKCSALLGKPKLFFIQNYIEQRHLQEQSSFVEADGDLAIPQVADILWSQSMMDASVLEKSPNSSSYYLSTLAELLIDPRKRTLPLLDIFLELNNRVYKRNRDHPMEQYSLLLKHTLRKKLFFSQS